MRNKSGNTVQFYLQLTVKFTPNPNVVLNKVIVSDKLLGLLRFGFGSGFISYARVKLQS